MEQLYSRYNSRSLSLVSLVKLIQKEPPRALCPEDYNKEMTLEIPSKMYCLCTENLQSELLCCCRKLIHNFRPIRIKNSTAL